MSTLQIPWVSVQDFALVTDPEFWAEYSLLTEEEKENPSTDENVVLVTRYELYESALLEATWVLRTLAHGRVHPAECWSEDYNVGRRCKLILMRTPVDQVISVQSVELCDNGSAQDIPYCRDSASTINFCCNDPYSSLRPSNLCCGGKGNVVRVLYRTLSTLPAGTEAKIIWLADQYVKAVTPGAKCELPGRVTSITRAGVSWSLLDPMEFLGAGFIGVGRLDSWLVVARRAFSQASIVDPLYSNRVSTTQVDCSTGFTGGMWPFTDTSSAVSGGSELALVLNGEGAQTITFNFDVDISGWAVAFEINVAADDESTTIASTEGGSPTLSFTVSGTNSLVLHLSQSAMDAMEDGVLYYYDLWRTDVSEDAELMHGTIRRNDT